MNEVKPVNQLINSSARLFNWVDYLLFGATLLVSSLIGVYHAWKGASSSTSNYLMGGKKMGIVPIALSMTATSISSVAMLGMPVDVYLNGTMLWWNVLGTTFGILIASQLYLPVLFNLQVISANQYLELRFNPIIRRLTSILYIVKHTFYQGIVVYGPSLALKQVTGMDVYMAVTIMFVICIFYTSIGGIKAVVWTDAIQIIIMYGSVITLLVKGVSDVGGLDAVWQRNENSSRTEFFNIDPDPTTRHTIWSLLIGGAFLWVSVFSTDQVVVQRFLAMPSLRKAQISVYGNLLTMAGIVSLCIYCGMVAYAKYFDCDPVSSKMIQKADQIIPFFLMDTAGDWNGLPGLFVAGIVSGSLSTLSSGLNAVALVILEDFIRPCFPNLEDHTATRITKFVSVGFGCFCFASVFLISQVKTIFDATLSFSGAVAGSILGVFSLGLFVPWANSIGAATGMVTSFVLMTWLGIATQMAKARGLTHNQMKPLSIENCYRFNVTIPSNASFEYNGNQEELIPELYILKISYKWYTLMGLALTLIIGTLASLASGRQNPELLNRQLTVYSLFTARKACKNSPKEKEMIQKYRKNLCERVRGLTV